MNNDDELRNDDCRIEFVYFVTFSVLHCETYGVHRFGKQFLNIWKRGIIHVFFWHFPTRESKFFPLFSSRRIEVFVLLSNSFPWQLALRKLLFSWCWECGVRWENGLYSLLTGVFQWRKIALKEVFHRRQSVSFHFLGQKMRRKRLKTTCLPRRKKKCFLAFFSCLRWENASLSAIHLMQLFPRNFKWLPFDYRAKNCFFFLYSSVFYTINHLDIYRYVYCTYMFW